MTRRNGHKLFRVNFLTSAHLLLPLASLDSPSTPTLYFAIHLIGCEALMGPTRSFHLP
jgi:hypothetical protein